MSGFLALEDGTVFRGQSVGAEGVAFGEAVFTTAMTGYQEVVTDPSYAEQVVCFTAPMVGNYGVARWRSESVRTHARAVVMREARGPELDRLARRPRARGPVRNRHAVARLAPAPGGRDAGRCSLGRGLRSTPCSSRCALNLRWPAARSPPRSRQREPYVFSDTGAAHIAVVDYGCKVSILNRLAWKGAAVTVYPHDADADELARYDGVLLSNGPGDPSRFRLR